MRSAMDEPSYGEGRRRAPVHGPEPHPILRHGKRRHHMPLGLPAIEERPHGDRPVTIEPRLDQFSRYLRPRRSRPTVAHPTAGTVIDHLDRRGAALHTA
jgi:hypothetical protein